MPYEYQLDVRIAWDGTSSVASIICVNIKPMHDDAHCVCMIQETHSLSEENRALFEFYRIFCNIEVIPSILSLTFLCEFVNGLWMSVS